MRCCHCGFELVADRTGDGVRVPFGQGASFVLSARCPYPRCARVVCVQANDASAKLDAYGDVGTIVTMNDAVRWSPSAVASSASAWLWLCGLIVLFSAIPAVGLREAFDSLRCGGIAWLLFLGGSCLALVPVIYFVRAIACAAHDALRGAARARATVREGAAHGLRLAPDPRTYRSH